MVFTDKQIAKAKLLASDAEIVRCRKLFTLYRTNDSGYAFFRLQSLSNMNDIMLRHANGKPLTKPLKDWINSWINDAGYLGDSMRALVAAIDAFVGKTIRR